MVLVPALLLTSSDLWLLCCSSSSRMHAVWLPARTPRSTQVSRRCIFMPIWPLLYFVRNACLQCPRVAHYRTVCRYIGCTGLAQCRFYFRLLTGLTKRAER